MSNAEMRIWFWNNITDHIDDCDEVDWTGLTETWADEHDVPMDRNGLDINHPAHIVAREVAEERGLA